MEQFIESAVNIIRAAVVSGFLVYIVLGGTLLVATIGVFGSWRRVAGYVLGWLLAALVIFIYTSSTGMLRPSTGSFITTGSAIDIWSLALPGLAGLGIGFGLIFVLAKLGEEEGAQAIIIAIVTAGSAIMLFFMSVSPAVTRSLIGTFSIAFTIGALAYVVLRGIPRKT